MTRKRRLIGVCLLVVMAGALALHLRAAWDVAYSESCAGQLAGQVRWLFENAAPRGRCPPLANLRSFHRNPVVSSPDQFVFVSHGLLCSVEMDKRQPQCSILIRIGNPVLFTQVLTLERGGPMRLLKPCVTGGVVRSFLQKKGGRGE